MIAEHTAGGAGVVCETRKRAQEAEYALHYSGEFLLRGGTYEHSRAQTSELEILPL